MGGVAVLQPQSCLKDTLIYSPMKYHQNPNPNSSPTRSNRRKRSPTRLHDKKNNTSKHTVVADFPAKNLVMGQVKILRRGEELKESPAAKDRASEVGEKKAKVEDSDDLVLSSTDRLGPEPEMVPKQARLTDFYAGSAIIASPPPSSLPFPAFFTKKCVLSKTDDATTDLRRILRLDLP
uniref:Uncharacterized protein n=1 Tax=Davidia involucrata TaxID=16924 RepID=A0A5B7BCB2_DAVIN